MENFELNVDVLKLAKQGNSKAIADLLNSQIESKGITAIVIKDKCSHKEERLRIIFQYEQEKSREKILLFTQRFFQKLNSQSISIVMIYGRKKGNDAADWRGEIKLSRANELTDSFNLLSEPINLQRESRQRKQGGFKQNAPKIAESKESENNNLKTGILPKNNNLSSADRYLIYFTLFFFFFSILMAVHFGRTLQVILSVFLAGYVMACLLPSKAWHRSILFSAATTYMFFPVGFYFTWKNSFPNKRRWYYFSAAFVAFLLPSLLFVSSPSNTPSSDSSSSDPSNIPTPTSSESQGVGTVWECYKSESGVYEILEYPAPRERPGISCTKIK